MEPLALLQRINHVHHTTFELRERYTDGEQGAFVVVDALGQQGVLKWAVGMNNLAWMQGAQTLTSLLRTLEYPAPEYLLLGKLPEGIYSIQRALPGTSNRLALIHVPRLLALNQIQVGRADWHQEAVDTLLLGRDGYCLHSAMQQHSRRTADLLRTLQALARRYQHVPHRTDDIVHGDFQSTNILTHGEEVTGVVDWDGAGSGDCSFDLATLFFYCYDQDEMREHVWTHARTRAALPLLTLYLAHLILRQVDWSLRLHDQATSERYIIRAEAILHMLASDL